MMGQNALIRCLLIFITAIAVTMKVGHAEDAGEGELENEDTRELRLEPEFAQERVKFKSVLFGDEFSPRVPTWIGLVDDSPLVFVKRRFARAGDSGGLTTWNRETGKIQFLVDSFPYIGGFVSMPEPVVWSTEGDQLTLERYPGNEKRTVKLDTPDEIRKLVTGSLDHDFVIEQRDDGVLWVIDLVNGNLRHRFETNTRIDALAYSPQAKLLVTCGIASATPMEKTDFRSFMLVWDMESGELRYRHRFDYNVRAIAFSPEGNYLIAAGGTHENVTVTSRGNFEILRPGTPDWSRRFQTKSTIWAACFVNQERIAVGMEDGTLEVFDWKDGESMATLQPHDGWVSGIAVEGPYIYSCSWDRTICMWRYFSYDEDE